MKSLTQKILDFEKKVSVFAQSLVEEDKKKNVKDIIRAMFYEYCNAVTSMENVDEFWSAEDFLSISKGQYPDWYKSLILQSMLQNIYNVIEDRSLHGSTQEVFWHKKVWDNSVNDAALEHLRNNGFKVDVQKNGNWLVDWSGKEVA